MFCGSSSSTAVVPDLPGKDLLKAIALCNNSYCDEVNFKKRADYFNGDIIELIEDKTVDTQLYVVLSKTDRILYVVFRGTSSAKDKAADRKGAFINYYVKDPQHPTHVLKVVEGFNMQLEAVREKLLKFVDDNAADYDTLFITGHSLGAAIATIFVTMYADHNASLSTPQSKTVKCITYGCPRVGNRPFTRYYTRIVSPANHWRVYHNRDLISKIAFPIVVHHIPGNALRISGSSGNRWTLIQKDSNAVPIPCWDGFTYHDTLRYMASIGSFFPELKDDHAELTKYFSEK